MFSKRYRTCCPIVPWLPSDLYSPLNVELDGDEEMYLGFLKDVSKSYKTNTNPNGKTQYSLHWAKLLESNDASLAGLVVVAEMSLFYHLALEEEDQPDAVMELGDWEHLERFFEMIRSLKPFDSQSAIMKRYDEHVKRYQDSAQNGFNSSYLDPHNAVPAFQTTIQDCLNQYLAAPKD
jgi:hypothetical protein